MFRSTFGVILVSLSLAALVGCSGGSDDPPAPTGQDKTSAQQGEKEKSTGTGKEDQGKETSSAGPECEAFLDCCDEVAADQPAFAGACDSSRKSIDDAIEKGASTDTYESSCKQALSGMQSAGHCK